jgi:hypothetical protein
MKCKGFGRKLPKYPPGTTTAEGATAQIVERLSSGLTSKVLFPTRAEIFTLQSKADVLLFCIRKQLVIIFLAGSQRLFKLLRLVW